MKRVIVISAFLFSIVAASAQQFVHLADSIRKVRAVPEIGYAVFSTDKILDIGVAGFRKYKAKDSARLTDRFHLGTNTFAFTSWIAGKLVDLKKITWNTTFLSVYPQYKGKLQPEYARIDLKGLLSNTAGVPPYASIDDYVKVPTFQGDIRNQRKEFAFWVLQKPAMSATREKKMAESIAGYTIAASMLEKVSGLSWEQLVDEYINKPLGISIKFGWPTKISTDQPFGHWSRYGSMAAESPDTWVKAYGPVAAATDINLSIADYVKFLQANLRGLRGGKSLLGKNTLDLIHFGVNDYSFGWDNGVIGADRISSHLGQSYLFSSYVELIPEKNLGVLVVCNNGDPSGRSGAIGLCRLLRDYYLSHNLQP